MSGSAGAPRSSLYEKPNRRREEHAVPAASDRSRAAAQTARRPLVLHERLQGRPAPAMHASRRCGLHHHSGLVFGLPRAGVLDHPVLLADVAQEGAGGRFRRARERERPAAHGERTRATRRTRARLRSDSRRSRRRASRHARCVRARASGGGRQAGACARAAFRPLGVDAQRRRRSLLRISSGRSRAHAAASPPHRRPPPTSRANPACSTPRRRRSGNAIRPRTRARWR